MHKQTLSAYVPMDRLQALAAGRTIPARSDGTAVFTDIAGFTPMTERLVTELGPRRGAEEITRTLDHTYDLLINAVHAYSGSVISFSGDGFLCWFNADSGHRAVAAASAMQQALKNACLETYQTSDSQPIQIKAAAVAGPVCRFLVGNPDIQVFEVVAGEIIDRLTYMANTVSRDRIIIDDNILNTLRDRVTVRKKGPGFIVEGIPESIDPCPWPSVCVDLLPDEKLRRYVIPVVRTRIQAGQAEFLAELRPGVAVFLCFEGIDYSTDPDAEAKLDEYVRWVQDVVGRYDGHVLQITTGDKGNILYISFGAVTTHENDAERSVECSLELQQVPVELSPIRRTRIGVSRGNVRVGASGSPRRRTFAALGDEVNVAARLMQAAGDSEIRCSGRIYHATSATWEFEELPGLHLKGKTGILPVFRPITRKSNSRKKYESTFFGRKSELRKLKAVLKDVLSGSLRIILLQGEAGIGKSRLIQELRRTAETRSMRVLAGNGSHLERQNPYHAWRDILRSIFNINEQVDSENTGRNVEELIKSIDPSLSNRTGLLNDILHLKLPESDLTRSFDAKLRHESLTTLLITVLRHLLSRGPALIVLDDAHWLDSLSWQLALSIARASQDKPLFMVVSLRPSEIMLPPEYREIAAIRNTALLSLAGLDAEDASALALSRLALEKDELPEGITDMVNDRAGGNPLFVEELIRSFSESLHTHTGDEKRAAQRKLEMLLSHTPDTVEKVILSRMDRLGPHEQLTLKVASVIGRNFMTSIVRDVHPLEQEKPYIPKYLDHLVERDFATVDTRKSESAYSFKHAIIHQVAYDTLLFEQRRNLHDHVARWYEHRYSEDLDEYFGLLVHHWNRAENWNQERVYARLAAESAAARYANQEALTFFDRAIDLVPQGDHGERYDLIMGRLQIYNILGKRELQAQDLEELRLLAETLADSKRQIEVLLCHIDYHVAVSDNAKALVYGERALGLIRKNMDPSLEARCQLKLGKVHIRRSDWNGSTKTLREAQETAKRLNLRGIEAGAIRSLGVVAWHRGDYQTSLSLTTEALDIYRTIGDRPGEEAALCNIGMISYALGRYDKTKQYCGRALEVAHEIGDRERVCNALNNNAAAAYCLGEYSEAESSYLEVHNIRREIGDRWGECLVLSNLGNIATDKGHYLEAMEYHERSFKLSREIRDQMAEFTSLLNLGMVMVQLNRYEEAHRYLDQGLEMSRKLEDRQGEGITLTDLGFLHYRMEDYESAGRYHHDALEIADSLGDQRLKGFALTRLGNVLLALGRYDEAGFAFVNAADIRDKLGETNLRMESLAGLARLLLIQGDADGAMEKTDVIIRHLEAPQRIEGHPLDGTDEPVRVLLTCYRVLHSKGNPLADDVLRQGYDLLRGRAVRIKNKENKHQFLYGNPDHREIISLYGR